MNCQLFAAQLDDLVDGALKPHEQQLLQSHMSQCTACHENWQQELQFRQLLREHDVPAPAPGFEQRAFDRLPVRKQAASPRKAFVAGFGGAIAAGFILMLVASLIYNPASQVPELPGIQLTLDQSKKVNMVFEVPEQVAEATFSMQVPANILIAGREGLHQIEWKTALKKGKNLLSLPIVAKSAESGELIAKIKYGDKEKIFRLKLGVNALKQGMTEVITEAV